MAESDLKRIIRRLIVVRAVISVILLGSATFAQITAPGSFPVNPFFFLIGVTFALTMTYAATLRYVDRYGWLVEMQLAGDAIIVSAFIYVTGGITSYFSSLYVLPIIAGSIVRFRRGGLMVAMLSAVLYLGLVTDQYFSAAGWLRHPWIGPAYGLPTRRVAQYTTALNVFGFFAVALLSGSLAESVRSTGARLAQASTRIADLQAFNQHVIDSLPSGLATTDSALRILTFNRAAAAITGCPLAEVVGRPVDEVLQLPGDTVEALRRDAIGARGRRVEYRYRTTGGADIELGLGMSYLQTPGGRAGYLFTFQDVTDVKKLERDARMQQRLAAVGEMAAGIAHEIRNPLASMSGSIQILRQELPLSAEQEQLMDIVLRESDRLNNTIRSFLAYARPQRFAIARFDVRRVVQDTALLLRNSSDVREGHVIDTGVPPHELWYEADEGQLKQILWNLATNGLRAMPDGGTLRIDAGPDASGGILLTVRDQGVGIAADQLDHLFQPFHGAFERGSGLGLAIVHRIVTDYNGEIQVSSQPGAGTSVAVRLPARAVALT